MAANHEVVERRLNRPETVWRGKRRHRGMHRHDGVFSQISIVQNFFAFLFVFGFRNHSGVEGLFEIQ